MDIYESNQKSNLQMACIPRKESSDRNKVEIEGK